MLSYPYGSKTECFVVESVLQMQREQSAPNKVPKEVSLQEEIKGKRQKYRPLLILGLKGYNSYKVIVH